MFKHLFYRIKAFIATAIAPSPEAALKHLARTSAALSMSAKAYGNALNAENDLRVESYMRQYDNDNKERAVREASDNRTAAVHSRKARAERVAARIDEILA